MPWTARHRWISVLLLVAVFSVGMAASIILFHDKDSSPRISDTEQRIVTACLILASIVTGYARLEYVTRVKAHDLAGGQQVIATEARLANMAATEASQVVHEKLNGVLAREIRSIVREELGALNRESCVDMVKQTLAELGIISVKEIEKDKLL